jgi:hypothetical protein
MVGATLATVVGVNAASAAAPIGLTGYTVVTAAPGTIPANGAGQSIAEYVNCKPTQVAVSAGVKSQSPLVYIRTIQPGSNPNSWLTVVTMSANLPTATTFNAYAVCVDTSSVPGYHVASNLNVAVHSPGGASANVSCAAGEVALGGGVVNHNPASYLSTSQPLPGGTGWSVTVYNTATLSYNESFGVYAFCVPQADIASYAINTATTATPGTSLTGSIAGSSALTGTASAPACQAGTVASGGGTSNSNATYGYVSTDIPTANGQSWTETSTIATPSATTETSLPNVVCATGTATVVITATNASMIYGGTAPALTYTTSGLVNGDTLTTPATCTSVGLTMGLGTYPITCSGADAGSHYAVTYVSGALTVKKATLFITPDTQSVTYGQPDPSFTTTTSGLVGTDTVTTPPTCQVAGPHTNVGVYPITCSGADAGPNYTITYGSGSLHVNPASVVITPDSKSIVYGDPEPAYTSSVTGLLPGDSLITPASCQVNGAHANAGTYPITCSGANAGPNYTISYGPGTLTIAKKAGVVTPDPQEITYGDADPTFTYTIAGLLPGDTIPAQPTCGVTGPHSNAGTYVITCSGGDGGQNYTLDETNTSTLTVDKATVSIVPNNQTITYGQPDPTFTFTPVGLVGSDQLVTDPTCGVAGPHANAGVYPITCSGADAGANYTVTYQAGTLTVNRAVLTVTADNKARYYGVANPPLTATITGYVNGDTAATAYTGHPTLSTTATATSNAGTYPITASAGTLHSSNYTFTFVPGTLTIVPAPIVVAPRTITLLGSLLIGRVPFSAKVTSAATGHPVPGAVVTFSATAINGYKFGCTATSNALGVASCTSNNVLAQALTLPPAYTATVAASMNYQAGFGTGRFTLL